MTERSRMQQLITGLQILEKYVGDAGMDFDFQHDIALFGGPREVTIGEQKTLDECGFFWSEEYDCWARFS